MNLDSMVNHIRTKGGNKPNQNSEVFHPSNMYAGGGGRRKGIPSKNLKKKNLHESPTTKKEAWHLVGIGICTRHILLRVCYSG